MAQQRRTPDAVTKHRDIGTGPYLAKIVSHLDPSFMGNLEVTLLRSRKNTIGEDTQTFVVRCAMPFFGYTGFEYTGNNSAESSSTAEAYNDTQKSYGMWFVPPDVGVTVLVTFVDGDPAQGYWIGCVPSRFANNMVPAIAGSKEVDIDAADRKKYDWPGKNKPALPVSEVNRRLNTSEAGQGQVDPRKIKKPLHPIAEHFLEQGLIEDDVRGTTNSSSRREVPSMVFGISTPGPLDRRPGAKKGTVGTVNHQATIPISRLGGTQFVMDDGDDRFQRKTPASEGPVDYADVLAGEKGDPTIPYNEYTRLRTRTGHQILMHNSEDLIYIGNSRGTAWVELTSNGKIDIFSEDSISIHTKNDLNIRADRDINLEAGRNINIKATAEYQSPTELYNEKKIVDGQGFDNGRIQIESAFDTNILIGANGKIETRQYQAANNQAADGIFNVNIKGSTKISTGTGSLGNYNFDLNTSGSNLFTAGSNTNILSGSQHIETAAQIHMNGPQAASAAIASRITDLSKHINLITDKDSEWASTRYQSGELESIMRRIPMHEPWVLHEHFAPQNLKPEFTDRELE